ncbi:MULTISPECIES: ferritin-like domain-containing protein [unclassified Mucilaginibacter]|uniref:ferritin-like domain-containing protein n=1 Tax=unclassified Mucilaginibacter TaxID=2617802 RepID=UPI002AC96CDC|nr:MULTISPECIES: ferritin-like domain-containing protein [unclassified Mucilaginibacter]MEB0248955.1 ferritin-like domain-containing protein [Mucilaginibacter sp. 5B2]MEB0260317.1 ferritin-like domain-containing protein [Mucilaginibacter sp. 10I4]MEB0279356.1 ferritin-like domain-containing protein [Mucilaginibacter sp. 10B2]MEB0302212.1 ferritin-like domain-containing protein [Mucilaginibacter sp. 5C4]WPX21729.1 ferritin-like domain-containing protein [Mucilaginibacter sp. 5C4]
MKTTLLFTDDNRLANRPVSYKDIDEKALHAMVQSAVNVELFTIPLYMTSLYSLQGMHEINSKGSNFYEGRKWPGMAASAKPQSENEQAFNAVFSVFVAEMLHLQIISNLAKVVGYDPKFTCEPLQDEKTYAWKCYSPDSSVLPGILDFKDTVKSTHIKVKLGPMDKDQCNLFLAIEQTEKAALADIREDKKHKYEEKAPYNNWKEGQPLPMFGSIGNMYLQLWNYLSIEYVDGITLWEIVYKKGLAKSQAVSTKGGDNRKLEYAIQKEVFNPGRLDATQTSQDEYPYMPTSINTGDLEKALYDVLNMINGITDQGEGGGVIDEILQRVSKSRNLKAPLTLTVVQDMFQPKCPVLRAKYPSFNATGVEVDSAKAEARGHFGKMDHYETFAFVLELVRSGKIETWDQWHAKGNKWTPEMLQTKAYNPALYPQLPLSGDVAGALNRLKLNDVDGKNFDLFSRASTGAIAGVTRVLNDYFQNPKTAFPYPSMGGSGDRLSICWAVFGKVPDISLGVTSKDYPPLNRNEHLYHACQGLNLDEDIVKDPASCAPVQLFHACKGSNECKGEGGCGFVQSTGGGGVCGQPTNNAFLKAKGSKVSPYSPPSDNACGSLGGCAVPMSASQMYPSLSAPNEYQMQLNNFGPKPKYQPTPFAIVDYAQGDLVYDVAWNAYAAVLKKRGVPIPEKPKPSDLRLAFPPST